MVSATFAAMISELTIQEYFNLDTLVPLVDVRSPGEFGRGRIAGAVNIPLFSDEERSHVGTVYVQESREKAIALGYSYVNPKLEWYIQESIKVAPGRNIAVHCWRGGMRSRAFAEHLHTNGFRQVFVIKGGYKAFRRCVLSFFEQPFHLIVLGGYTGSGKTLILREIAKTGRQVVDLEGLAHHKGSAFGGLGQTPQPSVEQFENNLFEVLRSFDPNAPIWIEDESHGIGQAKIPMPFYRQMRSQKLLFVEIPKEVRAKHLTEEYAGYDNNALAQAIRGITKRLGYDNEKKAQQLLADKNYYEVAMLMLRYYDKAYERGAAERNPLMVEHIVLDVLDYKNNADTIIKFIEDHGWDKTHTV